MRLRAESDSTLTANVITGFDYRALAASITINRKSALLRSPRREALGRPSDCQHSVLYNRSSARLHSPLNCLRMSTGPNAR
jgi:hypothetical protein